jgi:hypothetical protein
LTVIEFGKPEIPGTFIAALRPASDVAVLGEREPDSGGLHNECIAEWGLQVHRRIRCTPTSFNSPIFTVTVSAVAV